MSQKKSVRAGAPLVELIVAIGIFALASAITLRLFLAAFYTQRQARDLNHAMLITQSTAELVKSSEDIASLAGSLETAGQLDAQTLTLGYDKEWNPTTDDPYVTLRIVWSNTSGLVTADITVEKTAPYPFQKDKDDHTIYTLRVTDYRPAVRGGTAQ